MSDTIKIAPSPVASSSILFSRTDTKEAFLEIKTDGTVIWKGREVESDADFRAAMMEVHQHMCGSVKGELPAVRMALAEVARVTAERDALADEVDRLRLQVEISDHCVAVVKADRDQARREVCELLARSMRGPKQVAAERGWDCFENEEAN